MRNFLLTICALLLPVSLAHAGVIGKSIEGEGGRVNVFELDVDGFVSYSVDILDGSSVAAFAVSNGGTPHPYASSERDSWVGTVIDEEDWDEGRNIVGKTGGVSFNTASIGSYSSFFGTDPLVSIFYLNSSGTGVVIDEGSDEVLQFYLVGDAASEFVALSGTGAIIDGSLASSSAVPEPSSFLLFALTGLGVLGISRMSKKRQEQASERV